MQLWDSVGLPFTIDDPQPVRVVRAEEVLERQRYRQGERTPHATDHEWLWITTLAQSVVDARTIRRLGHDRWKNENNGWMDLTKHWAFKHGFLHACHHRPKQRTGPARTGAEPRLGGRDPDPAHRLRLVFGLSATPFQAGSAGS